MREKVVTTGHRYGKSFHFSAARRSQSVANTIIDFKCVMVIAQTYQTHTRITCCKTIRNGRHPTMRSHKPFSLRAPAGRMGTHIIHNVPQTLISISVILSKFAQSLSLSRSRPRAYVGYCAFSSMIDPAHTKDMFVHTFAILSRAAETYVHTCMPICDCNTT